MTLHWDKFNCRESRSILLMHYGCLLVPVLLQKKCIYPGIYNCHCVHGISRILAKQSLGTTRAVRNKSAASEPDSRSDGVSLSVLTPCRLFLHCIRRRSGEELKFRRLSLPVVETSSPSTTVTRGWMACGSNFFSDRAQKLSPRLRYIFFGRNGVEPEWNEANAATGRGGKCNKVLPRGRAIDRQPKHNLLKAP